MTRPKQMTKAERVAWGHAVDAMRRLEWDTHASLIATGQLPDGWDEIWNHRAPRDTSRQANADHKRDVAACLEDVFAKAHAGASAMFDFGAGARPG